MSPIKPFTIAIPDSKLASLRSKLDLATFPNDVPMADDWSYGVPVSDLKRLVARWRDEGGFDWRAAERKLNDLPQFTTSVGVEGFGELEIHFIHKKSGRKGSIPLLFCHGCTSPFLLRFSGAVK
jgi:hypothetical protein